jgi:hypothetical protein
MKGVASNIFSFLPAGSKLCGKIHERADKQGKKLPEGRFFSPCYTEQ